MPRENQVQHEVKLLHKSFPKTGLTAFVEAA